MDVEYNVSGDFLAATDVDDLCTPTAELLSVEVQGADITALIGDQLREEITAAIESAWS